METRRASSWAPAFVALSAIWGSSFVLIKVADRALSPTEVALGRVGVGAIVLLIALAVSHEALPRGMRVWGHLAFIGLIGTAVPFTLFAYGEQHISAVLAGIWNATTPLMTLLAALVLLDDERPTPTRVAGLAIGFLGAIVLLGPWSGLGGGALRGDLACLAAAAMYGIAFPYAKRYLSPRGISPTGLATGQLVCACAELAIIVAIVGSAPGHITPAVAASVLALGALGTGFAYVLYYGLIAKAGATTASTVTYVIPIFSTVLGIVVLGESLQWNEPVGALIVLGGVAVSQGLAVPLRRRAVAGDAG